MFVGNKMPVYFDGHNLSSLLNVLNVERGIGPGKSNTVIKGGRKKGSKLVKSTYDSKEIPMTISLTRDLASKRRELAEILNVDEPKKLIFGDEPDKYYWAIPDGNFNIDEIPQYGSGTLTWLVPDGVAYSIDEKYFNIDSDTVTIVNNGTESAIVGVDVNFESNGDAIGFVTEDSIVQFGWPYASDSENYVPKVTILNDGMTSSNKSKWVENAARIRWREDDGDNTSKIAGTLKWDTSSVGPATFGSVPADKKSYWHGPSISYSFVNAFANVDAYHRVNFKSTKKGKARITQQGIVEINYLDADNNFVMGCELKDNTPNKEETTVSFFVGDTRVHTVKLPSKAMVLGGFFGSIQMTKVGNKFQFRVAKIRGSDWKELWAQTKTFYNDTIAQLEINRCDTWFGQWSDRDTVDMDLTHTKIVGLNTEDDSLISKTFLNGDNIYFDGEENVFFINGVSDDSYRIVGSSSSIIVPVGTSEVSVATDATINGRLFIRERFV